ncbi:MAG TPA: MarR family winged helix-turn-helix transcriptional regulator [Gemmatimonadaceae bacterium]|nr:MarR family winged helix-turn-helix transcriptional regulator [Gemmatimonadaceae bacterium]
MSPTDDTARAMNAVRSVVRALRLNTRSIEGKLGISLAQLFVLQQLSDRPADSLNELAERTATHQSSVSVVVRRLVDRGLVTRVASSADRRRVQIALTPDGEAMLRGAPPTVQSDLIQGMSRMQPEQRATLADLLETWVLASGIDLAAAPMMFEDEPPARVASG